MKPTSGFQVGGSAPDKYERHNGPIMTRFVEALIGRAAVALGDAVLDLACGTGFVARRAAEVVGPGGRVAGLDLNPAMVAKARSISGPNSVPLTWHEGSAMDLPFADGEFQRVLCQQGVQFFPDLARSASEMARVLRSDGRVAVSFRSPLNSQTYMAAQVIGLQAVLGDSATPIAMAFRLEPTAVFDALVGAGFHDVAVEEVVAEVTLPQPLREYARGQIGSLPIAAAFAALPAARQDQYLSGLLEALAEYRQPDGAYRCAFASWVLSASK